MAQFVKRYAGFFLLVAAISGLIYLNIGGSVQADTTTTITTTASTSMTTTASTLPAIAAVDIRGCVVRPGTYAVVAGATVDDVIALAGGTTARADLSGVNRAKAVYDGMVVLIPELTATTVVREYVYVDVKGAVQYPGVYRIELGLRVYDAIMMAGGFTGNADVMAINLAKSVTDEMMIVIPFTAATTIDGTEDTDDTAGKININTATLDQLDTLYGIGYILAQRIIDYRAEYGDFEAIEDIMKVDGIKESVYEQIKDDIVV